MRSTWNRYFIKSITLKCGTNTAVNHLANSLSSCLKYLPRLVSHLSLFQVRTQVRKTIVHVPQVRTHPIWATRARPATHTRIVITRTPTSTSSTRTITTRRGIAICCWLINTLWAARTRAAAIRPRSRITADQGRPEMIVKRRWGESVQVRPGRSTFPPPVSCSRTTLVTLRLWWTSTFRGPSTLAIRMRTKVSGDKRRGWPLINSRLRIRWIDNWFPSHRIAKNERTKRMKSSTVHIALQIWFVSLTRRSAGGEIRISECTVIGGWFEWRDNEIGRGRDRWTNDHLGEQCDCTHLVNNQVVFLSVVSYLPGWLAGNRRNDRDNENGSRNNCSDVFVSPATKIIDDRHRSIRSCSVIEAETASFSPQYLLGISCGRGEEERESKKGTKAERVPIRDKVQSKISLLRSRKWLRLHLQMLEKSRLVAIIIRSTV